MGMSYADRHQIHTVVYHELLSSILKILGKLDLTSTKGVSTMEQQVRDVYMIHLSLLQMCLLTIVLRYL